MKKISLLIIALTALLSLAACGEKTEPKKNDPSDSQNFTRVEVSVLANEKTIPETFTVECSLEKEFCEKLGKSNVFDPVPADTACTELYGGPQAIKITAYTNKPAEEAIFTRVNGCEIARYDEVAKMLDGLTTIEFQAPSWNPDV